MYYGQVESTTELFNIKQNFNPLYFLFDRVYFSTFSL